MITNICLLLEALSILLCLHYLYGEKFRLDIVTVSYLSIYMIIMTGINYYNLPKMYTMTTYPIIFLYCGIKFGFKWKAIIVNNILYIAIISGIQLIASLLYYFIFKVQFFDDVRLLAVNCIAFLLVLILLPKCKLNKVSDYLQKKERIYVIALCISIIVATYYLIQYKERNSIGLVQSVLLFASIMFICFLVFQLGNYKVKSKEIETELKMHKLYADSFQNMIENIRLRQHEFDNHIHTIYSMHYTYDNYEDFVNAQKNYIEEVIEENHYNKLLKVRNPLIAGFLYGKFVEIEKLGIEISYKININKFDIGVPIYKLVEIFGNLINNAVEALKVSEEEKCLFISLIEIDGKFIMEVRNRSRYIDFNEREMFFKKGYSQKGTDRGLGLYHVNKICNEYMLNISCECIDIEDKNWLSIVVTNREENARRRLV